MQTPWFMFWFRCYNQKTKCATTYSRFQVMLHAQYNSKLDTLARSHMHIRCERLDSLLALLADQNSLFWNFWFVSLRSEVGLHQCPPGSGFSREAVPVPVLNFLSMRFRFRFSKFSQCGSGSGSGSLKKMRLTAVPVPLDPVPNWSFLHPNVKET